MNNLDKVQQSGVDITQMSPEEKQVVQSLSPQELDTLLKAKGQFDNLTKGHNVTSLKVL